MQQFSVHFLHSDEYISNINTVRFLKIHHLWVPTVPKKRIMVTSSSGVYFFLEFEHASRCCKSENIWTLLSLIFTWVLILPGLHTEYTFNFKKRAILGKAKLKPPKVQAVVSPPRLVGPKPQDRKKGNNQSYIHSQQGTKPQASEVHKVRQFKLARPKAETLIATFPAGSTHCNEDAVHYVKLILLCTAPFANPLKHDTPTYVT